MKVPILFYSSKKKEKLFVFSSCMLLIIKTFRCYLFKKHISLDLKIFFVYLFVGGADDTAACVVATELFALVHIMLPICMIISCRACLYTSQVLLGFSLIPRIIQ